MSEDHVLSPAVAFSIFGDRRPSHYVLVGDEIRPASLLEWARFFEAGNRAIGKDYLGPNREVFVSTVFLGLDHNFFGSGPPVLFETMIFGGPHDEFCDRYRTVAEAREGHGFALFLARVTCPLPLGLYAPSRWRRLTGWLRRTFGFIG